MIAAERDDLIGTDVHARLELHEGAGSFAPFLVGPGYDGGELHRRVL